MTYPWKSVNANVAPWVILVDELSHWLGCLVYGMNHLMMIAWWTCLHVISPWGGRLSRLLSIYYCCFYFPFFHCWSHRRFDGKLSYVDNQVKGNTIHCKSFLSNQNHQNVETFETKVARFSYKHIVWKLFKMSHLNFGIFHQFLSY